jgi:hypothetical protein
MVLAALIAFGVLLMAWLAAPAQQRRREAAPKPVSAPTPTSMERLPEAA